MLESLTNVVKSNHMNVAQLLGYSAMQGYSLAFRFPQLGLS